MGPIRRYLRITKFSILEVRIYLDDPAQAQTWLLNPRNPALDRIMQAVRPLVLPKLREENERIRGRGKKQRGLKDSVVQGDFEVSIYLIDTTTRHAVMTKTKVLQQKPRIQSNASKLTHWVTKEDDAPIEIDDGPVQLREESDDEQGPHLSDFAELPADANATDEPPRKRTRRRQPDAADDDASLFVPEADVTDDEGFSNDASRAAGASDDKKKLGLRTAYDGFGIYGKTLCLIVKRRGDYRNQGTLAEGVEAGRQMLENFVSTQAQGLDAFQDA